MLEKAKKAEERQSSALRSGEGAMLTFVDLKQVYLTLRNACYFEHLGNGKDGTDTHDARWKTSYGACYVLSENLRDG